MNPNSGNRSSSTQLTGRSTVSSSPRPTFDELSTGRTTCRSSATQSYYTDAGPSSAPQPNTCPSPQSSPQSYTSSSKSPRPDIGPGLSRLPERNAGLDPSSLLRSSSGYCSPSLSRLNTDPGPSTVSHPNANPSSLLLLSNSPRPSTSSSPQLLGILNTPPRSARPHPYQRQLSSSKVTEVQSAPPKAQIAKPHFVPSVLASSLVVAISDQRPTPILQNVVGTANLGCELDLADINRRTRNSEYNPQRFSGIVMRIREPHTTSLLFHSGKMVVTGAKSEADCLLAARKFARICQMVGYGVRFHSFRVTNMVATCDLKFPIRVESLNMMHGQFSSYEPELFPGLVYRMVCPRVVVLVFVNGKLCFTGAKSVEELHLALENIYPILKSFRKQ